VRLKNWVPGTPVGERVPLLASNGTWAGVTGPKTSECLVPS